MTTFLTSFGDLCHAILALFSEDSSANSACHLGAQHSRKHLACLEIDSLLRNRHNLV